MDSQDRKIAASKPCQFCGAEPRPMSKTICGGWECGAYIEFNNTEYSIVRGNLCFVRSNALTPIYLSKSEIERVVDALNYHYNCIDIDEHEKNLEIAKKFTEPLNTYNPTIDPSTIKFIDELREANKASNISSVKYGE